MDIKTIINQIETSLSSSQNPKQEAWWLLEKLTGQNKAQLLAQKDFSLTTNQQKKLNLWVEERTVDHKPLQYILGSVPFCNLKILVRKPILIPRPETEQWTTWLIEKLKPMKEHPVKILDLCCGTGCIALAIAKAFPNFELTATDINSEAIKLSLENKKYNDIKNVCFITSDVYNKIKGKFDVIVSNPPYITEEEWEELDVEVKEWEDKVALAANDQGLALYKKIISSAPNFLQNNTLLSNRDIPNIILEIGEDQGKAVTKILMESGFTDMQIHKDLAQKNRFICAKLLH